MKAYLSPEDVNYLSDVDGEIIVPDDGILDMTYFMKMWGSGINLGKRSIDCNINPDSHSLGNSLIGVLNGLRA